jgi:TonB family protein
MNTHQRARDTRSRRWIIACFAATLLLSPIASTQTANEKANYPDVIIPLRGKPIRGNIIKFGGTTLYVEVVKRGLKKLVTFEIDSLKEIRKDFGSLQIEIWNRTSGKRFAAAESDVPSPSLREPFAPVVKRDTAAALAIERDSIYVGTLDRKDTSRSQSTLVDQLPFTTRREESEFPPEAKSKRLGGLVELRLWIDKAGVPSKYQVVQCTDSIFVTNSVAAAMKWEFSPAIVKGTPVGVWASVTFEYKIQK